LHATSTTAVTSTILKLHLVKLSLHVIDLLNPITLELLIALRGLRFAETRVARHACELIV